MMFSDPEAISNVLLCLEDVSALRIPPGEIKLSNWNLTHANVIWNGKLRLIEEESCIDSIEESSGSDEDITGDNSSSGRTVEILEPCKRLRLKMQLYNSIDGQDKEWAEVWYIPLKRNNSDSEVEPYYIARNCQPTIQVTPESHKYYKIIAQVPGSGYLPLHISAINSDSCQLVQVALGLKFPDSFAAVSFAEAIARFGKRFSNVEDQYFHELEVREMKNKISSLSLGIEEHEGTHERFEESQSQGSDSDFGEFIES